MAIRIVFCKDLCKSCYQTSRKGIREGYVPAVVFVLERDGKV